MLITLFFQYCQSDQIQPKSQFLFHKNLPPRDFSIMTHFDCAISNHTFIFQNSKRSLLQPPLDLPSWDSSDFSSNSSTFPSTTSLSDRRLFILLSLFLSHFFSSSKNDTITYFCTTAPYVYKFYECAASLILLSENKEIKPKIEG